MRKIKELKGEEHRRSLVKEGSEVSTLRAEGKGTLQNIFKMFKFKKYKYK